MAEFLTTSGVSYKIERIIKNAKKQVFLVSPYLQLSQNFFERLKDAERNKVEIKIIYGKNELNPREMELLGNLKKLTLLFSANLHAKCYFNETEMVLTSMNMYEYSEKNNREMGVYLNIEKDKQLYMDAMEETLSIMSSCQFMDINKETKKNKIFSFGTPKSGPFETPSKNGHCIRCGDNIPFDIERPYCGSCYQTWAQFENPEYEEYNCHKCGKNNYSTMIKPVCYSCYKSL